MAAPVKWSEVLAVKGEPVSAISAKVAKSEKVLQAQQEAYNKSKGAKHDPEIHGLSRNKVESIVRPMLSGAAWNFCGKEYVAELFEAL